MTAELLASSHRGDGGQFVLRLDAHPDPVVLKHYGLKRGWWKTGLRQLGFRLGLGLSSIRPRDRFRTEQELLTRWREEGFDVPRILGAGDAACPFLLLEHCPGPTLKDWLRSSGAAATERRDLVARLGATVAPRLARAVERADTRLLHPHPTVQHVLVSGSRLVFFDLELCYRPTRDLGALAAREHRGWRDSLARSAGADADALVAAFTAACPLPAHR